MGGDTSCATGFRFSINSNKFKWEILLLNQKSQNITDLIRIITMLTFMTSSIIGTNFITNICSTNRSNGLLVPLNDV